MEPIAQQLNANRIKKRDLLLRLYRLTVRQADAIGKDDIVRLEDALNGRQRLAAEIEVLDRAYRELLDTAMSQSGIAETAASAAAPLEEEMRGIIRETIALDAQSREDAQKKLEQYKSELKRELKSSQRMNSYMGMFQPVESAYIDSKK
ncbi:MAG: hypothetical protein AAGU74_02510 [Bacillota bacterium]